MLFSDARPPIGLTTRCDDVARSPAPGPNVQAHKPTEAVNVPSACLLVSPLFCCLDRKQKKKILQIHTFGQNEQVQSDYCAYVCRDHLAARRLRLRLQLRLDKQKGTALSKRPHDRLKGI